MHVYRGIKKQTSPYFSTLKVHYYIFGVYLLQFFLSRCLLQVENLYLATNLENYYFYVMLITCKCTPFYKKSDCDVKSEPPYLATTLSICSTY